MAVATSDAPPLLTTEAGRVRSTILTVGIGEILVKLGFVPITAVIPALSAGVGVSTADGAWILTAFILPLAGALLVSGRLGDLIGDRHIFGLGAVLYAVTSAAAGLTQSFEMLLVARAGQGIAAAMISGNNLAILVRGVPHEIRGRAIAVVATGSTLVGLIGASLGTVAVSIGGWPILFWGTVPLAIWAAVRARRLPARTRPLGRVSIDWTGVVLLMLTITLAAITLNHPHTNEAAIPLFHVGLPVLALVFGLVLVVVERRVPVPLLDWSRLRDVPFAAAIGVNAVLHLTMMATMFLGPVLVVRGLGMSTKAGGMLMVMTQMASVMTAFLGGWLYDRTRAAWIRPAAAVTLGMGFAGWAIAGINGSYAGLVAAGLFGGLGTGVLTAVNNTVIMSALPPDARGVASGMLETTRHLGHAFGVTISMAIVASFMLGASGPVEEAAGLRLGFFWACLTMVAAAGVGALLAFVKPRRV